MSTKGIPHRRRPVAPLPLPSDDPLFDVARPVPIHQTPHERVRETLRVARAILPRDLTPITRFFATRDLFRSQER